MRPLLFDKLSQLWRRLLFYLRRDQFNRELEEEMRFHLELKAQENAGAGMAPMEARYAAQRQFGNLTLLLEVSRDMWAVRSIETFFQDLRYGARMLMKNPGFTLIAVVTLALGIGANTAIFTIVNAVLLRQLPYPQAERLVAVGAQFGSVRLNAVDDPRFLFWHKHQKSFEALAAHMGMGGVNLTGDGLPELVSGQRVSIDFFHVMGIAPAVGRGFTPEEDRNGGAKVAVLSDAFLDRSCPAQRPGRSRSAQSRGPAPAQRQADETNSAMPM
ncbi:MAG TPA: permease prefix domain 1-containing protein [Blastocatellia bacterium]|nr:permease prefix domain 1-containing protein [Blastocatellia bacterium]